MNVLDKFKCGDMQGVSVPDKMTAYCMDGGENMPDMRKECDLGGCTCCDYLLVREKSIVLVEFGDLGKTCKNIEKECACPSECGKFLHGNDRRLDEERKDKCINNALRRENVLKIYGSLLMLCKLSKFSCVERMLDEKKYDFWLVAEGKDAKYVVGNAKGRRLHTRLQGGMGKAIRNINIIAIDELDEMFK